MKKLAVSVVLYCLMSAVLSASHVYVRSDGPSDGNGKSWKTAFNSIDAAIANLQTNPDDTTFWVAAGVYSPITIYSPDGVPGGAAGDSFSSGLLTFNLPDGVKIYGGFLGNEKHLSDRPKVPNPMVGLNKTDQDVHVPSKVVNYQLTILNGAGSDSWHVVTIGNDIAKTGANVGLFDLTISGGFADGPDSGSLDSIFSITSVDYAHDTGGGVYARFGSQVDITNVQFINNESSGANATVFAKGMPVLSGGGALSAIDEGTVITLKNSYFTFNNAFVFGVGGGAVSSIFEAAVNVDRCLFADNLSNRTGGAIRGKDSGDITITGSYFARNIARDLNTILDEAGGAIDMFQGSLKVMSSTFLNNEGLVGGGAIFFHTFLDDGDTYTMDVNHCFFEGNVAGPFGGGGIFIFGQGQHEGSNVSIRNSQFHENSAGLGGAIYNNSFEAQISKCIFQNNLADAWGGAVVADNFGEALLFSPLAFADRPVTTIDHCFFSCNKTRGVQPIPFGFPPFFTTPGIFNLFAELAPLINGLPIVGSVDQEIVSGGGAVAVILAGVAEISKSTFVCNKAITGTGGAILVGGVTGEVTNLDTQMTFNTFDFATAIVDCCKFKHNSPNNVRAVDLANVGPGPDGITLIIKKCNGSK